MIRVPRTPARLVVLGVVLLWVVSPLSLGGLITVAVRAHTGDGIGVGLGVVLLVWAAVSTLCLLCGFAALVAGVLTWWRARRGGALLQTDRDEDAAGASTSSGIEERLGL